MQWEHHQTSKRVAAKQTGDPVPPLPQFGTEADANPTVKTEKKEEDDSDKCIRLGKYEVKRSVAQSIFESLKGIKFHSAKGRRRDSRRALQQTPEVSAGHRHS